MDWVAIGGPTPWSLAQGHLALRQLAQSTVARLTPTPSIEPTCQGRGQPGLGFWEMRPYSRTPCLPPSRAQQGRHRNEDRPQRRGLSRRPRLHSAGLAWGGKPLGLLHSVTWRHGAPATHVALTPVGRGTTGLGCEAGGDLGTNTERGTRNTRRREARYHGMGYDCRVLRYYSITQQIHRVSCAQSVFAKVKLQYIR